MKKPELSIIVVNFNTKSYLERCVSSIIKNGQSVENEIIVVDNNSSDGSVPLVKKDFPQVRLIENMRNVGFARANNQAIVEAQGVYFLFLNPDAEVLPGALGILVDFIKQRPRVGLVAPMLLNSDGSLQRSCRDFPSLKLELSKAVGLTKNFPQHSLFGHVRRKDWDHDRIAEVDQPMGACLLVSRTALEKAGYFDERFFMYYDDVDLCYRIAARGFKIFFIPEAKVIHHLGKSFSKNMPRMLYHIYRSKFLFYKKHYNFIKQFAVYQLTMIEMLYRLAVYGFLSIIKPRDRTEISLRERAYAYIFFRFVTGQLTV
jgi:GT2 family glycosyltransferase